VDNGTWEQLDPMYVDLDWAGALAGRTTDPVLSTSRYEFTAGDVHIRFSWVDPESGWQTGFFRGHLDPFAFELRDDEDFGPQVEGLSGVGTFDTNLARLLGVRRRATLTNMSFLLDEVYGQAGGDRSAVGGCCQYVDLALTPVPEPGLTLVIMTGGIWMLRRRLTRR
jgi:hypothetical protein